MKVQPEIAANDSVKPPEQQIGSYTPKATKIVDDQPFVCKRRDHCEDEKVNSLHPYFFELLDMVSVKRRHNTRSEIAFREQYLKTLKVSENKTVPFNVLKSPSGEVLAYYYKASEDPVLWSAHCDSVHSGSGNVKVAFDPFINLVYVEDESCPLGADDAAGIWILFQMIREGVPGTYIFHVGEEQGGVGSSGVALHHQTFLSRFKAAIAFDRKDVCSVITHQGWGRCCSDAFADSFANALNAHGLQLVKDDTGVFTDTANYVDHIGECTNISVGYFDEHTQKESLDAEYLVNLLDALVKAFGKSLDALVFKRLPGEEESSYDKYYKGSNVMWPKNFYDKIAYYDRPTPPWEGEESMYFSEDLDQIEEDFFKVTSYDKSSALTYLRDDCYNDPEFALYEEEIEQAINALSYLNKAKMEDYITRTPKNFLANVLKKLLHEAGYV